LSTKHHILLSNLFGSLLVLCIWIVAAFALPNPSTSTFIELEATEVAESQREKRTQHETVLASLEIEEEKETQDDKFENATDWKNSLSQLCYNPSSYAGVVSIQPSLFRSGNALYILFHCLKIPFSRFF
jgi:hypothetical protein